MIIAHVALNFAFGINGDCFSQGFPLEMGRENKAIGIAVDQNHIRSPMAVEQLSPVGLGIDAPTSCAVGVRFPRLEENRLLWV